jgi:hypothetical protein
MPAPPPRARSRDDRHVGVTLCRAAPVSTAPASALESETTMTDRDALRRERIAHDSDRLLEAVGEIRGLEEKKREVEMSTPPFHELADRIAERARDVFGYAADERDTGDELSDRQDRSIEDVTARER